MNYADINEYIYNYIKSDKTNSAIMLTSEWGTGKTYYFNEILKKFLHKQNVNCIYISLYGLKDLFEVSKNIYFEAKFKLFNKKTKAKKEIKIKKGGFYEEIYYFHKMEIL